MVYLSLGSNLGDREGMLRAALAALARRRFRVEVVSSIYETAPQDITDQPWFLNLCCGGATEYSPLDLLTCSLAVERTFGRDRAVGAPGGPRPLDIDVLLYDDLIIALPELRIPHPRLLSRRFVLVPLLEVAPDLVHPETCRALREYLPGTESQEVRYFAPAPALPDE